MEDSNCVGLMVTNEPLLTRICVENVAEMTFEVDTGASHSMLSRSSYYKLQNDLVMKGRKNLLYQGQQLDVKLADGSTSVSGVGTVQMSIAETVNYGKPILVTFFVMKGGSNLLRRHTVQRLWPEAYNSLVRAIGAKSQ